MITEMLFPGAAALGLSARRAAPDALLLRQLCWITCVTDRRNA
jgi:hypothetical protein